jgi:hypothetical protein
MSRIYLCPTAAAVCLAAVTLCNSSWGYTFDRTFDGVTYTIVEADPFLSGGSPGNTVNMNNPGQFFAHPELGPPFYFDGLYRWRDFGLNVNVPPAAASEPDVFEIGGQDVAPPDLRTTISGLPNATYDVYVAFMVEPNRPSNPVPPATITADLDVGQAKPTTLRGPRGQQGLILTGQPPIPETYELALAPLGQVTGTEIKVLAGPMWLGDVSDDYMNGLDDLSIVLSHFGQLVPPGDRSMGDTDGNGFITQSDLTNVTYEAWGEKGYAPGRRGDYVGVAYKLSGSGSGTGGSVPEPASILLLAGGVLSLIGCRFRQRKRFAVVSISVLLIVALSPLAALAAIDGTFVQITSEEGVSPPANRVSQDLVVNATTDWLGAELLITLSPAGSLIYQDFNAGSPNPVHAPPNPGNFGTFPTLRYDTYVTGSGGVAGGAATSAGAAVDVGGINNISTGGTFNSQKVDLTWYTLSTSDVGTFTLGRFTLTNTAQGTWALRLDSDEAVAPYYSTFLLHGKVQNGLLVSSLQGDYNGNGKVDAADYVAWRKNPNPYLGNPAGYNVWRANFGNPPGSGSDLVGTTAVPEPSSAISIFVGLMLITNFCRAPSKRYLK